MRTALRKLGIVLLGLMPALVSTPVPGQELPDIGAPWSSTLSRNEAYQLGRMIVHQIREADGILEDPELTQYLQAVGHRLSSRASDGTDRFEFFLVKDGSINAFALPGGFIGVHAGLIQATRTESELAGVLAHEIAHVTQDHIARRIYAQSTTGLATTAAMIAAVLLGALSGAGGEAVTAAVSVSQGLSIQQQISHTRKHEYEADRIGLGILASAGFDPRGMPDFFETLGRRSGISGSQIPEFLRTHPLESNRVAEARNRAAAYAVRDVPDSLYYALAKARLQVLLADTPSGAVNHFENLSPQGSVLEADAATRYGYATALLNADEPGRAETFYRSLVDEQSHVTAFHIGLAQSLIEQGRLADGLEAFERALRLFPRNIPLTMRYSRALLTHGRPDLAHELMLDLLNNIDYTADQLRLIALAASAAGDTGDAHYYMSEYHVVNGDLKLAIQQLRLALASPALEAVQRERFQARIREISEVLPPDKRNAANDDSGGNRWREAAPGARARTGSVSPPPSRTPTGP
jgi:predicted Zn-dependent protease